MNSFEPTPISAELAGLTLAAYLRQRLAGPSWTQVRRLVAARRVRIDGELCLDPARRLREGVRVELLGQSQAPPRHAESVCIRHVDAHLVVVEKPSRLNTVRHPAELDWNQRRRELSPTLQDVVSRLLAMRPDGRERTLSRLRIVHRLDKETSGLVVFARSALAERELGRQFRAHTVMRRYIAVVPGLVHSQRVASWLVRDRGDGRRGSGEHGQGKEAITHVEVIEHLSGYTLLGCRLETGRTHQIRIHLAELGHPICGEKVYNHRPDGTLTPDASGAPRLALHAAELGFQHPTTYEPMQWQMDLPPDLQGFITRLRQGRKRDAD